MTEPDQLADLVAEFLRLSRSGLSPSQIEWTLRDAHPEFDLVTFNEVARRAWEIEQAPP